MKKALRAIRKRIRIQRAIKGLFWGFLIGAVACLVQTIVSFFVPIESLWLCLLVAFVGPSCVLGLAAFLFPISVRTAARVADGCGLQERVITALALEANDAPMIRLQRQDAMQQLRALPVRDVLPFGIDRRLWISIVAAIAVCGILFLLPNPMHSLLRDREAVRLKLNAQAETIEKAAESIEKEGLTAEEQRELRRISSDMARQMRTAKDAREALARIDQLQSDMDQLRRQVRERQSTDNTQALASQPSLKSLADAMESGDSTQMDQALAELAQTLSNAEQKEKITNQMELAAELTEATEMMQMLESAAEALKADNIQAAMQIVSNYMQSALATGNSMDALMQMARMGAAQTGSSGTGSSGNGDTQSGGFSKAGLGTTQRDQGYKEGFTQSANTFGTGGIREKVGAYERIYDPTRLGGDQEATVVPGEKGEGESQQMTLGPGLGSFSGSVPYNQVVLDYQEAAAQAVSRSILPVAQQEWVTNYFDALID